MSDIDELLKEIFKHAEKSDLFYGFDADDLQSYALSFLKSNLDDLIIEHEDE